MITRRTLLGAAALAPALPLPAFAQDRPFAPQPGPWRTFEVTTVVDITDADGRIQAWVPTPAFADDAWFRPGESRVTASAGEARIINDTAARVGMAHVACPKAATVVHIEVVSRFSARDRAVVLTAANAPALTPAERQHFLAPTSMHPTDGIVKETAERATIGARSDLDKARFIYDWVVENTTRNPQTRGCGTGDIAAMLRSADLSGKCADLNALYVGLARAAGLPARDIYGIRVAPSAFGYKSLGANSATITKAQHCRADVFIEGIGWVPADPADVRKVVLEEPPGKLALDDAKVAAARKALIGAWETNWLAYNDANDVTLPGASFGPLSFFMYPQAETAMGQLDALDPDSFRYAITTREIT